MKKQILALDTNYSSVLSKQSSRSVNNMTTRRTSAIQETDEELNDSLNHTIWLLIIIFCYISQQ